MRPIDAYELLKEINDVYNGYMLSEQFAPADFARMVEAAPAVEPSPAKKWIPVTEKRPVEFEKVLVTYRLHYDNSIHVGIGNIIANDVNGRYHWNINEQDYIGWDMLAWMPLPTPYEPQESEDKE